MTAITYNQVLDRYFYLTGVVLLIYDHLLTLESEVRYIWTTDHTRVLAWYLLVRYFALCTDVTIFALSFVDFSVTDSSPRYLHSSHFKAATLILRVLAMYSFDKRVMASLASAAIIVICLFIVQAASPFTFLHSPDLAVQRAAVGSERPHVYRTNLSGCYSVSSNARKFWIAGAWEGVLATDLLCLGLTLYRGYARSHDETVLPRGSLWRILVRDGVMYYALSSSPVRGISLILNVLRLASFVLQMGPTFLCIILATSISDGLAVFTLAVSVTVVCRLMLNLHKAARKTMNFDPTVSRGIQFRHTSSSQHESGLSYAAPSTSSH
ncbi:hypothetical protein C8J57DRAFT_1521510 [Mycena rebaudengoi]|nr:hypothetical protein C8J57DRAFT_1521510 [Mycena rebaudengoi]